jgi:hypothetical protein
MPCKHRRIGIQHNAVLHATLSIWFPPSYSLNRAAPYIAVFFTVQLPSRWEKTFLRSAMDPAISRRTGRLTLVGLHLQIQN